MATLILSAVGQAVGGPIGALVGAVIGNQIDNRLFGRNVRREGPRLSDLAVQSSAYGAPIALVYGRNRLAGNVIWSTGLVEQRNEERSGGKGGGGRTTTVSFSYSASFAIALSGRPIVRIDRIWADGKLIRAAGGALSVGGSFRLHEGDESQLPDPLLEASEGIGQVPAYRGLAYVVFEGLQLAEFANRIPNLTFEAVADDGAVSLATIAGDLLHRIEATSLSDITALEGTVTGYGIAQPASLREMLEPLSEVQPFQAVESGSALRLLPLPPSPAVTLEQDRLGAASNERQAPRLIATRQQEWELPREVSVHYLDDGRDYQPNIQRARRLSSSGPAVETIELPVATSAANAKRAAERRLAMRWTAREIVSVTVPPALLAVEAGDAVAIGTQVVLVAELQWEAGSLRLSGPRFDPADLDSDATADSGLPISQTPQIQGPTHLELMALPTLPGASLTAPRFFAAAAGGDAHWRTALLFQSTDGGLDFTEVARFNNAAVIGTTRSALAQTSAHLWDRQSVLEVELLHDGMSLESRPDLAVLNGGNAALIGDEIIQFGTASLIGPGRYQVRDILRGRLGTDQIISAHPPGERFVLLNDGLVPIATALGAIGVARQFKAVGPNESLAAINAQSFTYGAENLRPLRPVHARVRRSLSGDIIIGWTRRSRQGFDWIDGADAPIAEESERYEIDILDGGTIRRTLSSTTPQAIYSAADQQADFGILPPQMTIRIHQLSALVGRGAALTVTV